MSALWSSPASALPFSCKLAPHMLSPQWLEPVTPCQRTSLRLLCMGPALHGACFAWGHRELRVPEDFHPRSPWQRVTPFLPLLSLGLPFPLPHWFFLTTHPSESLQLNYFSPPGAVSPSPSTSGKMLTDVRGSTGTPQAGPPQKEEPQVRRRLPCF